MLRAFALLVLFLSFTVSGTAQAHLSTRPTSDSLEARLVSQTENLGHAKYVCVRGSNAHKLWACKARVWLARESRQTWVKLHPPVHIYSPKAAICAVFGAYCSQALAVSYCETGGTYDIYARNGQYLGLFQMGDYARGTYGHSYTAYGQALAAYRYFIASGRGWAPWECKP